MITCISKRSEQGRDIKSFIESLTKINRMYPKINDMNETVSWLHGIRDFQEI